jgi:ribonucleoside-diphosphate reductase alpha chain
MREFHLRSPKDGSVRGKTVDARALFQKLVETRLATGEPYIVFSDTVNRMMPKHHRDLGLKVSTSNLCSEITLPTGRDHLGNDRTAVCCLSSLNLETWDEWNGDEALHRGRAALPRQRAAGLYRPRAGRNGARQVFGQCANARSAWA